MASEPPTDQTPSASPEGADREPPTFILQRPLDVRSVALSILALAAILFFLHTARSVLIPIVLAVLIAYALTPVVGWLERLRLPRVVGAGIVLLMLSSALAGAVYGLRGQAAQLLEDMPHAARQLRETVLEQRRAGNGALDRVQEAATEIDRTAEAAAGDDRPTRARDVQRVEVVQPPRVRDYLWIGSVGVATLIGQIVIVLFLSFFLLASGDLYKRKIVRIAGPSLSKKRITVQILDEVNRQIERFLLVRLFTSALVAVATWAALRALGMEGAALWGLLAGIFNTIPYFGPVIVSAGLAVVGFVEFGTLAMALAVAGIALAITGLEGWLLTPPLMGRAAHMNEVAIFVGLLFWSWMWGLWGTILAVPLMMILKVVSDRVEELQPVNELLGK